MTEILVVGWITLDFITHVKSFPTTQQGARAMEFDAACGGRAANQAMAITAIEGSVGLIARLGQDPHSAVLQEELNEIGVDSTAVGSAPAATGMRSIAVVDGEGQQIITYPGANDFLTVDDLNRRGDMFAAAKAVGVTTEAAGAVILRTLEMAEQHKCARVLTHTPGEHITDRVLASTDVVVLSSTQSAGLLDSGLAGRQSEHAARVLCQRGAPAAILLTPDNAVLATPTGAQMMPSPTALDGEEAVDAFVGGLLTGLAAGESLEQSLTRGVRIACLLVD